MSLLNDEEKEFYQRHLILSGFGEAAQQKLKQARVLVIGAGGLGCPVLSYLVAGGVGHITIVDDDRVSLTNLHRQVLFGHDDMGKNKAVTAAEKLKRQNPHVHLRAVTERFSVYNALKLIRQHDVIVDGSDNFATRYLVNDACVMGKKPFISGAIHQYSGQLSVFNHNGGPTYRCLFPDPPRPEDSPSCEQAGVLGILPGIIGTMMANEAVKLVTGLGDLLSGKFLTYDVLHHEQQIFRFKLDPANLSIKELEDYAFDCSEFPEIALDELKTSLQTGHEKVLIDVRDPDEFARQNLGGQNIPLGELEKATLLYDFHAQLVLICSSSIRSRAAGKILSGKGYKNIAVLKDGLG